MTNRCHQHNRVLIVRIVLGALLACLPVAAHAGSTKRPISDFLSAQGSVLADLGPVAGGELFAAKAFIWGNSLNQLYRIDYAGTDARALIAVGGPDVGTTYSGVIIERPLADGRVEDAIHLVTRNAIVFVDNASTFPVNCSNAGHTSFVLCPAVFGYNLVELANGIGEPVLADLVMDVTLINSAPGAPIPDLVFLSFTPSPTGAYLHSLSLRAVAVGPLRSAFGVIEGTLGLAKLHVTIDTNENVDDEIISVQVLGK